MRPLVLAEESLGPLLAEFERSASRPQQFPSVGPVPAAYDVVTEGFQALTHLAIEKNVSDLSLYTHGVVGVLERAAYAVKAVSVNSPPQNGARGVVFRVLDAGVNTPGV